MRTTRRSPLLLALSAIGVAAGAYGQLDRVGSEFQINSSTAFFQDFPSVAADADGDFVVVWRSPAGFASIFAQRFASSGSALGSDFQVNTSTAGNNRVPDVAMDADGDFVVVWFSDDLGSLVGRRFSSDGVVLVDDFKVVQEGTGTDPAVATEADGDFVVAWTSYDADGDDGGVVVGRFASDGTPLATELVVNTYTLFHQRNPDVSLDGDGNYVVVWDSTGNHDGDNAGVFARRFSSSGVAQGGEFVVNSYTSNAQLRPAVSRSSDGDFVVAWESYYQDDAKYGVFARVFSNNGSPLTDEFQVNIYTTSYQRFASVAANGAGAFVVTWSSDQDGSGFGAFARRFSSTGAAFGGEVQVNTYTNGEQLVSTIAMGGSSFVIAWQSNGQDGDSYGVFGQRFSTAITLDVDGDGEVNPLTDLILGLRYSFGFRGDDLIDGAVGENCTRCDAPAIEGYLEGLVQ